MQVNAEAPQRLGPGVSPERPRAPADSTPRPLRRRVARLLAAAACLGLAAPPAGAAQALDAPNVVAIDPMLVTSGQPTRAALGTLRQQGFQAVLYLAPSTVPDAVADEAAILAAQGIEFVHLPIPFGQPEERHALAVSQALQRLKGRKVLVHCQVNMRASSLVFLHRVIAGGQDAARAYASVSAVWSPQGPWRALLEAQLRKHGITFELL